MSDAAVQLRRLTHVLRVLMAAWHAADQTACAQQLAEAIRVAELDNPETD